MKIFTLLAAACASLAQATGCSNDGPDTPGTTISSSASWAYAFVVHDGVVYATTDAPVTGVGREIGAVTTYSDDEGTYEGNFSNRYPAGTKYYVVPGVDPAVSIAVATDGGYVRADAAGKYGAK
ncbi:hypothetical protein [Paenibacillus sp. GCM10023250]|uniref:hypothetical protein n=1 Tax=Paenibacillus sp. GCM10023250 TaxID=3252648 RepID=UPI00362130AB